MGTHDDPRSPDPDGAAGGPRAALELRWPDLMTRDGDPAAAVVDVVNVGDARWIPAAGDAFLAFGVLTEPGAPAPGIPFAFVGGPRGAVTLDPGERTRLAVSISTSAWAETRPGPHDLHVALIGPSARTAVPLRVDLTAETIARATGSGARPGPDAAELRASYAARIAWLRVRLAAGDALVPLAERLAGAASDAEAVARIRALLDVDDDHARRVLQSPLREFLPPAADATRREVAEAVRQRDELPATPGADGRAEADPA